MDIGAWWATQSMGPQRVGHAWVTGHTHTEGEVSDTWLEALTPGVVGCES